MLIYALLKIFDPGPALFTQLRVGSDGRTFTVYKFRTMRVGRRRNACDQLLTNDPRKAAAEWAEFQKLQNDPRVTLLGRLLRKSSLDELPQLLNIVRGEMSVIGPRPVTSGEIHRYGATYPYYTAVRPGRARPVAGEGPQQADLSRARRVRCSVREDVVDLAGLQDPAHGVPGRAAGRGAY